MRKACLAVLNLGLDWCRGWQTVMVYPGAFVARHDYMGESGVANGMPPLHREMDRSQWTRVFTRAREDFVARVDAGEPVPIDPYAAEAREEFFAVLSETFFEAPSQLRRFYPDVYEQLRLFYQQDPLGRD